VVEPVPTSAVTYEWNTTGCYRNTDYNNGYPQCFPVGQRTQTVVGNDLTADDAGNISCTVVVNGSSYSSELFLLRVSGTCTCLCKHFQV